MYHIGRRRDCGPSRPKNSGSCLGFERNDPSIPIPDVWPGVNIHGPAQRYTSGFVCTASYGESPIKLYTQIRNEQPETSLLRIGMRHYGHPNGSSNDRLPGGVPREWTSRGRPLATSLGHLKLPPTADRKEVWNLVPLGARRKGVWSRGLPPSTGRNRGELSLDNDRGRVWRGAHHIARGRA